MVHKIQKFCKSVWRRCDRIYTSQSFHQIRNISTKRKQVAAVSGPPGERRGGGAPEGGAGGAAGTVQQGIHYPTQFVSEIFRNF